MTGAARTFLHYNTDGRLALAFCGALEPALRTTCEAVREDGTSEPA